MTKYVKIREIITGTKVIPINSRNFKSELIPINMFCGFPVTVNALPTLEDTATAMR